MSGDPSKENHLVIIGAGGRVGVVVDAAGSETLIGVGAVVREGLTIGDRVLIGAGSVVVKPVPDRMQACGVPARSIPCDQDKQWII